MAVCGYTELMNENKLIEAWAEHIFDNMNNLIQEDASFEKAVL